MFTPKPLHRKSTNPEVIRRYKDPKPRQMFCMDIQVEAGVPEKAFITEWNRIVDNYDEYLPVWNEAIEAGDVLSAYRVKEMMRLVEEYKHIDEMPYELMNRTLDHIAVGDDMIKVVFQDGSIIVLS